MNDRMICYVPLINSASSNCCSTQAAYLALEPGGLSEIAHTRNAS
jgi:hypothetical protein